MQGLIVKIFTTLIVRRNYEIPAWYIRQSLASDQYGCRKIVARQLMVAMKP